MPLPASETGDFLGLGAFGPVKGWVGWGVWEPVPVAQEMSLGFYFPTPCRSSEGLLLLYFGWASVDGVEFLFVLIALLYSIVDLRFDQDCVGVCTAPCDCFP